MLILVTIIGSCRNQRFSDTEKIVKEWIGREIILPSSIQEISRVQDTCKYINAPYKIFVYIDSIGCTSCKLQLYKWNTLIKNASILMPDSINFIFYFQSKSEKELLNILKRDNFNNSVFIDKESKLDSIYHFSRDLNYQCFLLNKENKIVLVGNPALNPQIWDLYRKFIVKGEKKKENVQAVRTIAKIEPEIVEVNDLKLKKESIIEITIINMGNAPLLIYDITTSCGCTIPEWDSHPVPKGEKKYIKIKGTPEVLGYFRKTINIFCNTEGGMIQLSVKGVVKEDC